MSRVYELVAYYDCPDSGDTRNLACKSLFASPEVARAHAEEFKRWVCGKIKAKKCQDVTVVVRPIEVVE